jgi:hypothetical protein
MDIWNAMCGVSDAPGKEFGAVGTENLLVVGLAFFLPITKFVE